MKYQDENSKGTMDLDTYRNDNFTLYGFELSQVLDNIILVKYLDASDDGRDMVRNGIIVPTSAITRAWRVSQVVLAGPKCEQVKVGDIVCHPHDKGIIVSNISVKGVGSLKNAVFLNEDRIFGICNKEQKSTKE